RPALPNRYRAYESQAIRRFVSRPQGGSGSASIQTIRVVSVWKASSCDSCCVRMEADRREDPEARVIHSPSTIHHSPSTITHHPSVIFFYTSELGLSQI